MKRNIRPYTFLVEVEAIHPGWVAALSRPHWSRTLGRAGKHERATVYRAIEPAAGI